jgi:pyruvate dehydrogenase E2 component (dihydrolipoamide acetyltransferase)
MVTEIRLPKLSDEMDAATIVHWLKHVGEAVSEGEVIAELETEKAGVDLEAPSSGVLASILVAEGSEDIPVGTVLATIEAIGGYAPGQSPQRAAVTPAAPEEVPRLRANQSAMTALVSEQASMPVSTDGGSATGRKAGESVASTPLASMMAELAGLEVSSISAGRSGAVTRRQVEEALGLHKQRARPSKIRNEDRDEMSPAQVVPHNAIRKLTAARMTEAKQTIPHFYLSIECDVTSATSFLERLNRNTPPTRLTLTTLIIKTAAVALQRVPVLNAEFTPTHLVMRGVNIAVAVATASGLVAPVIKNVNEKMLLRIAEELDELVERAKGTRLLLRDSVGGTFTVSNLGMFGVTSVVPIITPGQSGVLGIGTARECPVIRDGAVAVGKVMTATLSGDHRALDGAQGAEFLRVFRELIEDPARLIV